MSKEEKVGNYKPVLWSLVLAAVLGWLLNTALLQGWAGRDACLAACSFVGDLFIRALKMVIVPLVFSSIVTGIASLGKVEGFARLGLKTIGYYALSSFLAIVLGLSLVQLMAPGKVGGEPNEALRAQIEGQAKQWSQSAEQEALPAGLSRAVESSQGVAQLLEIFKRMVPPNIVKAAAEGQMLGLIFFAILMALALAKLPGEGAIALRQAIGGLNEVMIQITHWIMRLAPIGIFALVLPAIASMGTELFTSLGKYMLTVVLALGLHCFVILPILLILLGKINPLQMFAAMRPVLVTAFSTASSSATLPMTLRAIQERVGVSKKVSSTVLPLGATVNMDGTALYECVAVLFLSQAFGWEMSMMTQLVVVILALLTSIGVAGIPSASLVAILIILKNVNIPHPEACLALLLSVDRLLDMCRTAVNVYSDSCGAAIIASSEKEKLFAR